MSEFIEPNNPLEEVPESLEAPKKVVKPRKSRAPKVDFEAGANAAPDPLLLEEVPKRGKGRPPKPVVEEDENEEPAVPKPKRKQTELQKLNFIKALETRKKNIELRRQAKELEQQVKEEQQEAKKAEVHRKIVKKAICIKKKQVLAEASLDEVSDCDLPDEIVEKIIKTQRAKKVSKPKPATPVEPVEPPTPKYTFV